MSLYTHSETMKLADERQLSAQLRTVVDGLEYEQYFFPAILLKAGQRVNGHDIATMLTVALEDFDLAFRGMPSQVRALLSLFPNFATAITDGNQAVLNDALQALAHLLDVVR